MADAELAVLPPALRQAGFLARLGGVGEKDLAGNGEDQRIAKAFEQRGQEVRRHPHIAVQQDHDVVGGGPESGIGAAAEAEVLFERYQLHLGKVAEHELGAAIPGAVIHHHDFVGRIARQGGDDGGQVLPEQIAPVPIGDDHAGGGGTDHRLWWSVGRSSGCTPSGHEPHQVGRQHGQRRQREQQWRNEQQRQSAENPFG